MRRLCLILLLLAAPASAQLLSSNRAARYNTCLQLAGTRPDRAIAYALGWRAEGGGGPARHCLAVAQFNNHEYATALKSFEAAGIASEDSRDGQAVAIWQQAAEAALIHEKPEEALRYLSRAIAGPGGITLSPRAEAALRLTRAETLVDLKRLDEADADLARAVELDPEIPGGWLLKATLARYRADWPAAEAALLEATKRAPEDPAVLFEAGNIASAQGKADLARQAWEAAADAGPDTAPGKAAQKALDALPAPANQGSDAPQ